MFVTNQHGLASQSREPLNDVLRIGHTAAEHEQLSLRRCERDCQFVVQSAVRIGDHLVFVDHQQHGTVTLDKTILLRLKSGDYDRRAQVFSNVARRDTDTPTTRAPFSKLVIRERARRDGINSLPAVLALLGP